MPTKKDEEAPIQCVCFEFDETKIKDTNTKEDEQKKPDHPTCQAVIATSPWKPDDNTQKNYCKKSNFVNCPRLKVFMKYQKAINTLKIMKIE